MILKTFMNLPLMLILSKHEPSRPTSRSWRRWRPTTTEAVGDSSTGEVVGRNLQRHLVAREDFDVVHPHLP